MSLVALDGATAVLDRPVGHPEHDTGHGRVAHIIGRSEDKTGAARTTESRVFGTEIEALCGHRMTAQHSTRGLPVCQKCKEIAEALTGPLDQGEPIQHA